MSNDHQHWHVRLYHSGTHNVELGSGAYVTVHGGGNEKLRYVGCLAIAELLNHGNCADILAGPAVLDGMNIKYSNGLDLTMCGADCDFDGKKELLHKLWERANQQDSGNKNGGK